MCVLGGGKFGAFGGLAPGGSLPCGVLFGESGAVLERLAEPRDSDPRSATEIGTSGSLGPAALDWAVR